MRLSKAGFDCQAKLASALYGIREIFRGTGRDCLIGWENGPISDAVGQLLQATPALKPQPDDKLEIVATGEAVFHAVRRLNYGKKHREKLIRGQGGRDLGGKDG